MDTGRLLCDQSTGGPSGLGFGGFQAAPGSLHRRDPAQHPSRSPRAQVGVGPAGWQGRGPRARVDPQHPSDRLFHEARSNACSGERQKDRPARESSLLTTEGHKALWATRGRGSAHP